MKLKIVNPLNLASVAAALLVARTFGLAGCAGGYAPKDKLVMALRSFNSGVRWQRHKEASAWMVGKLKTRYLDKVEELDEDLRISEVEQLRVTFRKKGKLAIVRYRYRWHTPKEMILRKGVIVQFWKWNKTAWVLIKVRQASGPPLPYFQPPSKKARPRPRPRARPGRAARPRPGQS